MRDLLDLMPPLRGGRHEVLELLVVPQDVLAERTPFATLHPLGTWTQQNGAYDSVDGS